MSTRTRLGPMPVLSSASMSSNLVSLATIKQSLSKVSYALSWVGTSPVGTVTVQVSNDYKLDPNGNLIGTPTWTSVWFNYQGSVVSSLPVTGNTGTGFIDIESSAYAIQLSYTYVSGTGLLTATVVGIVE